MKRILWVIALVFASALPAMGMDGVLQVGTSVVISFGPAVDKADGVTLKTGLVSALDNASTGIMLSKNGGAFAVRHATVTASTYDAYGNYRVTLDTTDTNATGILTVQYADATTLLVIKQTYMVVGATAYDRNVTGNIFSVADIWGYTTGNGRTLSSALNITSSGNKIGVGADDQVLLSATTHVGALVPTIGTIQGTAQAGGSSTITLAAGDTAGLQDYRGALICIISGTGSGQAAMIGDYIDSTKIATIAVCLSTNTGSWRVNPDGTSVYTIFYQRR